VITLGILTSIFLNGEWLTIQNEAWVLLFADFTSLVFGNDGLSHNLETSLLIIWLQLPLIFVFTLFCAFLINKLQNQRLFIYSFLASTIFTFFIFPSLPILNSLLPKLGGMRYLNVFSNLFIYLVLFVTISFVIQKHNKQLKRD
jgi:hypothetical protein